MIRKILAAGFISTGLFLACGGSLEGNGDCGCPIDAATDGGSTYCPSSLPAQGDSCSDADLWCEYGGDPDLNCNTIAHCTGGAWEVQKNGGGNCPTPPNVSDCPATFASVPVGELCGALVGTTCLYPQGFCGCSAGMGGPMPADAAAMATWMCDSPAAGCPMPRPKLGTSCSQQDLQCDYSPCSLPSGAILVCQGGAWQEEPYGCAL